MYIKTLHNLCFKQAAPKLQKFQFFLSDTSFPARALYLGSTI